MIVFGYLHITEEKIMRFNKNGRHAAFYALCMLTIVSVPALSACSPAAAPPANDTVALDEFDTLEVKVSSYDFTLQKGNSLSLEYVADKGMEPVIAKENGKLTVKQPSKLFFGSLFGAGHAAGSYTVTVPDGTKVNLKVKSSSGDVMLNDVEGELIEAETGSGHIECDKVKAGAVSFGTSSGDMELLRIFADDISCDSSSGEVELNNSTGRNVMCSSSSGDVEISLNGNSEGYSYYADTSSGEIKVNGKNAKKEFVSEDGKDGKVAVHTSSGDIEIEVK